MTIQVPLIDGAGVAAALPPAQCIAAMHDVLRSLHRGEVVQPLRSVTRLPEDAGALYTMPAFTPEPRSLAVKLITIFEGNRGGPLPTHQGIVVVFDADTGRPQLLLDAARLTAIRTAAVSACATAALSRPDAATLALIGSGVQAHSHGAFIPLVRPVRRILIWSRSGGGVRQLTDSLRALHGSIEIVACSTAGEAITAADIVCTTTSAQTPVVEGAWLQPGTHINAIGASTPGARELDTAAVCGAHVFVDSLEAARVEAGDLILAESERPGASLPWTELGAVLNGAAEGRRSDGEITLFKSVGLAAEDAAAAAIVVRNLDGGAA